MLLIESALKLRLIYRFQNPVSIGQVDDILTHAQRSFASPRSLPHYVLGAGIDESLLGLTFILHALLRRRQNVPFDTFLD